LSGNGHRCALQLNRLRPEPGYIILKVILLLPPFGNGGWVLYNLARYGAKAVITDIADAANSSGNQSG